MALGVALVCALDVVTRSMQLAFEEIIDTMAGRTALELSAGDGTLIPEELATAVAAVRGVELAVPVVSGTAFTADGSGEALAVHGVDLLHEAAVRAYQGVDETGELLDDPLRFLANPRGIILTRTFAERRHLREGDSIELDTPRGLRRFSILAVLEPSGIGRAHGGNLVVMDLTAAEDVFAQRGFVSRVDVVVERHVAIDEVRGMVRAALPAGINVTTPTQRKVDLHGVMAAFGWLLRAIGLVGVAVAFLIAFNGMSSGFERRGWQLGVLAAIGARPSAIWRLQMQEALVLGGLSALLGIILGFGLAHVLLPVIATATALNFNVIAPQARVAPSVASCVAAALVGVAVSCLAAWLPATRAVRLGVACSINGRGREIERSAAPPRWRAAIALWIAVAAAVSLQSVTRDAAFGLAATVLVVAATALFAFPFIGRLGARMVPALAAVAGSPGRLAVTALRESPRRAGVTTATIAVGMAAITWLLILAQSFETSVVDALGRAIRADVIVTSASIGSGFLEAPLGPEALAGVRSIPGIDAAAGWRALEWPYEGQAIGLSAYDGQYFRDRRFGEWPLETATPGDVWERVARGDGVVVSTSFVGSFGKGAGDRFVVGTPTGPLDVPILGVTVDFVSPKGTVEMSRELYAMRWRDPTTTRIFAVKQPGVDGGDLRRRIASSLGERFRIRVLSANELLDYFVTQVRRAFSVIPIFGVTVCLVVLIGLGGSLGASVVDRRRDLAIVRAIGLGPRALHRAVVLESLAIGCVGIVLALASGMILATVWTRGTFQLLLGWALTARVPPLRVTVVALATLGVCYVASLLPARRASAVEVTDVLRYE